jgi:hypothetical protein
MQNTAFWKAHPGLVWSNPDAADEVFIRAALMRPKFQTLLEIAVEFGLDRLHEEWRILCADPLVDTARVRENVERCLRHIALGSQDAARRNSEALGKTPG